jgi:hypothetical protein
VQGLDRLKDLDGLVAQEDARGNRPPRVPRAAS